MSRRLLMISPHFPPDTSAAAHRVRLLAPHLEAYGWTPTVLTLTSDSYEGRLDPELASLIPSSLRVERCRAIPASVTRPLGIGDLGIRAMLCLHREATRILSQQHYDALFITLYPAYPALLGPRLKRQFNVPFILDYQDPWVGSWGLTVGSGTDGRADIKSRLSRMLALWLEPKALGAADAITAVSELTYEQIRERIPHARDIPAVAIPLGGEPRDFEYLRANPRSNPFFDSADGLFHMCYTGTILPLGTETLRAFLEGLAEIRSSARKTYDRIRVHFFGTSNQSIGTMSERVIPHAIEFGVRDIITEHPARIDYLDAIAVQSMASALLLLGSSEHHYTASKLYPALLAGPPILAAYHEASSVSTIIRETNRPDVLLITYNDQVRARDMSGEFASQLRRLVEFPLPPVVQPIADNPYSAENLAGQLARLLDIVS